MNDWIYASQFTTGLFGFACIIAIAVMLIIVRGLTKEP